MAQYSPVEPTIGHEPLAQLEQALIAEFLRVHGHTLGTLHLLPEETAHALLTQASVYASGKLTEVESRAHLLHDLHEQS